MILTTLCTLLALSGANPKAEVPPIKPEAAALVRRDLRPGMTFVQLPATDARPVLWMQTTETTRAAWRSTMGTEPWKIHETEPRPGNDLPVAFVSWIEVQAFLERQNAADSEFHYRLPTEAEWMEACRAGEPEPSVLGTVAWYGANAFHGGEKYTHPVGRKAANAWGLQDCLGNVWEWVQDAHEGTEHILKGGSWRTEAAVTRAEERNWLPADQRAGDLGFRVVATPVQDETWGPWTTLEAGGNRIQARIRWVGSKEGRSQWCLNLRNDSDTPVTLTFRWALGADGRQEHATLEPARNHEFHSVFAATPATKGARPTLIALAWGPSPSPR